MKTNRYKCICKYIYINIARYDAATELWTTYTDSVFLGSNLNIFISNRPVTTQTSPRPDASTSDRQPIPVVTLYTASREHILRSDDVKYPSDYIDIHEMINSLEKHCPLDTQFRNEVFLPSFRRKARRNDPKRHHPDTVGPAGIKQFGYVL